MDQQKITEALNTLAGIRKQLYTLKAVVHPIRHDLLDGSQYDRNFELFADAIFDLLGEESSAIQCAKREAI